MSDSFTTILEKYRNTSFSEKHKGERFERLMKGFLLTDPRYSSRLKKVWMWNEFPGRKDLGGTDTGIDLVALTHDGDYWAVQCKCYQESTTIDKPAVDSFLSTSSREFKGEDLKTTTFAHRIWISTTNKWGANAHEVIKNQPIPFTRVNLDELKNASVDWGKLEKNISGEQARAPRKQLKEHQKVALAKTHEYFKTHNRGQLIMACGTGKTLNSLHIAEHETDGKGLILFLVPSIALLGQTLNEWCAEASEDINAICICSDPEISQKSKQLEDIDTTSVRDLALPASTNVDSILRQFKSLETSANKGITVVFSTYQSIDVIAKAQRALEENNPKYAQFDLIICDEAHRTTGITLKDEDESGFVKVHNNSFIKAKKRLYMTATPKIYDDEYRSGTIKRKAEDAGAVLCSMDDVNLYGEEIYRIGFGEAVNNQLLTDYKVLVLTLNQNDVPPAIQKMIADKESEINSDDASKLIGCINALSKKVLGDQGIIKETDPLPMRRAVAFCQSIKISKLITKAFNVATDSYIESLPTEEQNTMQLVSSKHIDGTMNATERSELLTWLKDEPKERECRVLTNVRCLSEGVDVPSLDAVMFLSARNSQVDVVQSVGRVMRRHPDKNCGYIIIPVIVPVDVEADKALDNNERYKVVWTVLNALRAHDDRFNATVNKLELNKKRPPQIIVGGMDYGFDADGNPVKKNDIDGESKQNELARQLTLQFEQIQNAVFAKMVLKVGNKDYWERWAKSVAVIAQRQTERITKLIADNSNHQQAFDGFLAGLHKNINASISQADAIEMLSQHIITKPIFDALFEDYSFVKNNPISQSMQKMMDLLEEQALEKDTQELAKFYEFAQTNIGKLDNADAKQKIIIRLYDSFFKVAFPKMVEKLGIVYTPVEVVDFIIHSVADILKKEFGRSISDENVHILDPFTGTGTFISRLLQSGVIDSRDLARKYTQEIHCNEIVLLAYYIAAVNIENTYHDMLPDTNTSYFPFDGICLTDTFQLGESSDADKLFSDMFPQNSKRVQRQQKTPLRIIFGNPPYSVGQNEANDDAKNQSYPELNKRISDTYAKLTNATNKNSLYDSYLKAFRWSTDRLDKTGGVISFVSNGAWLDGNSTDGFRKTLEKEFSSIYVFNLRGNARTSGVVRQKEGGGVFGLGSRTPISITLLVKNPDANVERATIYYHDIGDNLNREEKLKIVNGFKTFVNKNMPLIKLIPNEHGDWIGQRSDKYLSLFPVFDKENIKSSIFTISSNGIVTSRDAWVFNFSKIALKENIIRMISFYNSQVDLFKIEKKNNPKLEVDKFINKDAKNISWSSSLIPNLEKGNKTSFDDNSFRCAVYRPFNKQILYWGDKLIHRRAKFNILFPKANSHNIVIVSCGGISNEKYTLISDCLVDLHAYGDSQCFPLYYYEENTSKQGNLFDNNTEDYIRRDAISDFIYERAKALYGKTVTKEDIFYYVYGFLHNKEYREMFANDLKKMLPRLPLVENVSDFWAFSKAGRKLAELHINYESIPPCPEVVVKFAPLQNIVSAKGEDPKEAEYNKYAVQKMRFPQKNQKDTIIYNSHITIENIPALAYDYVVNGKSAIEWIMERYQITTHKESNICNNPNDWASEVGKPSYILDLLLSVINVSVQTVGVVEGLPRFEGVGVEEMVL